MKEVIKQLSQELNLPEDVIVKTYKAFWKFIRASIEQLPLKDVKTEEDFCKLKTNFNIPSLGKLNCTWDKVQRQITRRKYVKTIKDGIKDN